MSLGVSKNSLIFVVYPKIEVIPRYAVGHLRASTPKQTEESKAGIKRQEQAWDNWLDALTLSISPGQKVPRLWCIWQR